MQGKFLFFYFFFLERLRRKLFHGLAYFVLFNLSCEAVSETLFVEFKVSEKLWTPVPSASWLVFLLGFRCIHVPVYFKLSGAYYDQFLKGKLKPFFKESKLGAKFYSFLSREFRYSTHFGQK